MGKYEDQAKKLIEAQYKQGVADVETDRAAKIKELIKGVQTATSRSGMNWSNLERDLTKEGSEPISSEAVRSKTLLDINRQNNLLALLKPSGSGGGSRTYAPGANPYLPTGTPALTGAGQTTTAPQSTEQMPRVNLSGVKLPGIGIVETFLNSAIKTVMNAKPSSSTKKQPSKFKPTM